jgi:hypothetical protein
MKPPTFCRSVPGCLRALCLFAMLVPPASACIWDRDTLAMEQARFPEVIDLISGNFPRHSPEFYQWRLQHCQQLIAENPQQIELYDDLAVSQHKLGKHAAACETMRSKQAIRPGLYETYSNMGTFLIYTGDLAKAVEFVDKALAINPKAHFGREKYQKWLIEWVLAGKPRLNDQKAGDQFPSFPIYGFAAFVVSKQSIPSRKQMGADLRQEAIQGVLGMMRFADFDNPILQEALGDLLCAGQSDANASHLASLAYLHASQKAADPADKNRLADKFKAARATFIAGNQEEALIAELKEALAKGAKLAATVRNDEINWINQGKDPSAEFAQKYLVK